MILPMPPHRLLSYLHPRLLACLLRLPPYKPTPIPPPMSPTRHHPCSYQFLYLRCLCPNVPLYSSIHASTHATTNSSTHAIAGAQSMISSLAFAASYMPPPIPSTLCHYSSLHQYLPQSDHISTNGSTHALTLLRFIPITQLTPLPVPHMATPPHLPPPLRKHIPIPMLPPPMS